MADNINKKPINDSIMIEDYSVNNCNATWQYPLEFNPHSGAIEVGDAEKITYHISYTFHNTDKIIEFTTLNRKKPLTIFHIAADKVVVYEGVTIKKCFVSKKKLNFECYRKYTITMSQYREIKIAMIGL